MSDSRQVDASHQENIFFRDHYQKFMVILIIAIGGMLGLATFTMFQVTHRPVPPFFALSANGKKMTLVAYNEPNHSSPTLLRWASKASVAAYTFDFANYNQQLATARPYFTKAGWDGYQNAVSGLVQSIIEGQLFVNGVVSGQPVISAQGEEAGGYTWHVQLPFLVATQSSESTTSKKYMVLLTVVKVPTEENKEGIGIDRFVMTPA